MGKYWRRLSYITATILPQHQIRQGAAVYIMYTCVRQCCITAHVWGIYATYDNDLLISLINSPTGAWAESEGKLYFLCKSDFLSKRND